MGLRINEPEILSLTPASNVQRGSLPPISVLARETFWALYAICGADIDADADTRGGTDANVPYTRKLDQR